MSDKTLPQLTDDDRQLLADINRWRRRQGWNWGDMRGLVNGRFTNEATIAVDWMPADENPQGFTVTRRSHAGASWPVADFYRATSVRQAVDLLAALGVLPPVFSSQYQYGRKDGRWIANVDVDPARRCRRCGVRTGLKPVFAGIGYGHAGWECRHGCTEVARAGQRPAEPGELCTCGRQAVTVFTGGRFGDTGYCGMPDGGQGPCRFCGGPRHEGQRCPQYVLRPAGGAS